MDSVELRILCRLDGPGVVCGHGLWWAGFSRKRPCLLSCQELTECFLAHKGKGNDSQDDAEQHDDADDGLGSRSFGEALWRNEHGILKDM